ncbi:MULTISPECIES: flagellar hook-length control protein FliK [unclassified Caballeronia]|uniref:flagellar hook-length control protein FliK n=1 Tax=unclassified Caballeronia TaxID=2646786 RepID=UPI0028607693|nr:MULTISPECIES: flagellar hook-length control protein FliK [unclassified Caballeronia]MDR5752222.1 flagellar hook-length control protein FliK [Caballeronia sp. LZ024]MDR5841933.1 flagellar hook-length control protein FliK [Caballeronia sp. LZ031]
MVIIVTDSESTSSTSIPNADAASNIPVNSPVDTTVPAGSSMPNDAAASISSTVALPVNPTEQSTTTQASVIGTSADTTVPAVTQSTADQPTDSQSDGPELNHVFVGLDGSPINGLKYRLESDGVVVNGASDENGNARPVTSFSAGSDCTVSVLADTGIYKQLACYTVPTADTTVTLMSGSMVLESETQKHGGSSENVSNEPPVPTRDEGGTKAHPAYSSQDSSASGGSAAGSSSSTEGNAQSAGSPASSAQAANAASGSSAPAASATPAASPSPSTNKSHPQTSVKPKGGSGNPIPPKATIVKRDQLGHPQASPVATITDWASHQVHAVWHYIEDLFGLESNPVAGKAVPPNTSSSSNGNKTAASHTLAVVKNLVSIAEEQTEHTMPSSATVINIKQIADGSITYGSKPSKQSKGQCYMFVKIALWRANTIKFIKNKKGDFDAAGGSYAKVAGDFLMSQGFENVTSQLPDARWALPGDVIVYHVKGDTETADGHGQPGHIDIRTYHYYVSDFKRNYLCFSGGGGTHFYEVIGIHRKAGFSDPLTLARMRAFLKVIRSREAKVFFRLVTTKHTVLRRGYISFKAESKISPPILPAQIIKVRIRCHVRRGIVAMP